MVDWKSFLTRWSQELSKTELAQRLDPPPDSQDWLGYAPATEDEIAEAERRLGVLLPPSYRAFLLTSNGWRRTSAFIGRVRPAAEINWFRVENEHWADVYSEEGSNLTDERYFHYPDGTAPDYRARHMKSLLQISDVDDGVYLLNPEAVTPDGEWEAWFFANWIPGARRSPSFAHLMMTQYRSFRHLQKLGPSDDPPVTLPTPASHLPRVPAERIRTRQSKAPSLETLIEQLESPDLKVRAKAVRTFAGKLRGRPRSVRRPELVEPPSKLFYSSPDADVRSVCVHAITELADDGTEPPPLFDALSDPHPGVILSGIFALHDFPNPQAWAPLCAFIDSGSNPLFSTNAIMKLAEMGDERAVPTLSAVLVDQNSPFEQNFGTAALALGRCGRPGIEALLAASFHKDPRIRLAATIGLDTSGDMTVNARLHELEHDPDPRVRERASVRHGKPLW